MVVADELFQAVEPEAELACTWRTGRISRHTILHTVPGMNRTVEKKPASRLRVCVCQLLPTVFQENQESKTQHPIGQGLGFNVHDHRILFPRIVVNYPALRSFDVRNATDRPLLLKFSAVAANQSDAATGEFRLFRQNPYVVACCTQCSNS